MQIKISQPLNRLASLFPTELYVVGGFVRNQLLGVKNDDVDICSSLTLDKVEKLLKGSEFEFKVKSKILGTATIKRGEEIYEYTTFRRDFYPENSGQHSPESVEFIQSVEEDAKRRDFTCNAIYYDIKNDKIVDFYNGQEDVKKRILRTVETPDEVFCHDGVRILRLFRFQCELNFKIERETLESAFRHKENLRDISGERLVYEITKILHSPNKYKGLSKPRAYMKALNYFNKGGLWQVFGIDQQRLKFKMVKKVSHKSQGFLIDLIDNVNPISISYYLNLILSDSFGLSKKMAENYINILSGYYEALNRQQNKPYFFKYFNNFPQIYLLLIHKSKYLANKYQFFYKYIISHRLIMNVKELKISGDDIKKHYPTVKPNRYNPILESLLSDVFDGKLSNEKEELIQAVEQKLKYL
ncbi:MAG: CCA tRNA nucleotidyltransferase [Clostridia bacterium]|jgi:tRNA nucleotidyltransferase (CCA-adding enzyme)|nr:CCA tRNA nucleotidyltransferase [Clostridia bacterium]